jgi:hypothetical protein
VAQKLRRGKQRAWAGPLGVNFGPLWFGGGLIWRRSDLEGVWFGGCLSWKVAPHSSLLERGSFETRNSSALVGWNELRDWLQCFVKISVFRAKTSFPLDFPPRPPSSISGLAFPPKYKSRYNTVWNLLDAVVVNSWCCTRLVLTSQNIAGFIRGCPTTRE